MQNWSSDTFLFATDPHTIVYLLPSSSSSEPDLIKLIVPLISALIAIASLVWNYINSTRTKRLQLAISNNQFKQKIFEKFTFDPICSILKEYHKLIEGIELLHKEADPAKRVPKIKVVQQDVLSTLTMKLERELLTADRCSIVSRNDMCSKVVDLHDAVFIGFNAMCNDASLPNALEKGREDTIEAINQLVTQVIDMMIEVSQSLVDGKGA
jgi:hypothetical protein